MPSIIFFAARIGAPLVALIKKDGGFFYQGNERERRADIAAVLQRSGKTAPPYFFEGALK